MSMAWPHSSSADTFEDCLLSVDAGEYCEGPIGAYLDALCTCVNAANPAFTFSAGDCSFTVDQITAAVNRFDAACNSSSGSVPTDRCHALKHALEAVDLTNAQKNEVLRRARCPDRFPPDVDDDEYVPLPPPELPEPIGDPIIPGQPRRSAMGLAVQDNPFGVPGDHSPMVAGVDVQRGAFEPVIVDLSFPATGFPWVVGRSYSCQQVELDSGDYVHLDAEDYQGINWRQISQPRLRIAPPASGTYVGSIVLSLQNNLILVFVQATGGSNIYKSTGDQSGAVIYDSTAGTYTYYDQHGMQMVFLDGSVSPSTSRYQLWKMVDPAGNTAYVGIDGTKGSCASDGYTADGFIQEVHDSSGKRYLYEYSEDPIGGIKRLLSVTASVEVESEDWEPVGWVEYLYYATEEELAEGHGSLGDLKLVKVTIPTSATSGGNPVTVTRRTYYRYYASNWSSEPFNPGYPHALKYVLEPEGVRRYDPTGTSFESASDSALSSYAANYFEYEQRSSSTNPIRRISKTYTSGDCGCSGSTGNGTYQFAYINNYASAADFNVSPFEYAADWVTRTAVTRPDGTVELHYFDAQGLPLRDVTKVTVDTTDHYWVSEMVRNTGTGLVQSILSPAAVESYTPSTHAVTLRSSVGLAQEFAYTSVNGGRFVIDTMVKQGTGTTDRVLTATTEYVGVSYKAGGLSDDDAKIRRPLVVHSWVYDESTALASAARHGSSPPSGAHETSYSYEFWEDSDDTDVLFTVPKIITSELPKVAADQHGAGDSGGDPAVQSKVYLRKDGTTAFTQRAAYTTRTDPVLTYSLYENGQVIRSIVDPNEDQDTLIDDDDETDFALTLPDSDTGIGVVTQYSYDPQGRVSRTTLFDGSSSERDTLVFYTRLNDQRMVTLSVPKVEGSDPITSSMGPVSYSVSLHNGRSSASATLGLSGAGGTTTTDINSWISPTAADELAAVNSSVAAVSGLSTTIYNNAGSKPTQSRSYFDLTLTWPGVDETDYDQSEHVYDDMGRVVRTVDPTDTVNEMVYDGLGRVIAHRIGTTASGSVRTVDRMAYDGGDFGALVAGANSYMTKTQQIPFPLADGETDAPVGDADSDGDPYNNTRITQMVYDFRGRVKVTINPVWAPGGTTACSDYLPTAPHVVTEYDNRNRIVARASYRCYTGLSAATDPESTTTNRMSFSTSAYDARGQMYLAQDFEIDQSDGSIAQDEFDQNIVMHSMNWFTAEGQVIQTRGASFAKFAYDRLGRRTHAWQLATSDDDTGTLDYSEVLTIASNKTSVAGDEVLEESQMGYDAVTGLVLVSASIERHHNDAPGSTGGNPGELEPADDQDPTDRLHFILDPMSTDVVRGRIQISAMWYDELLRPRKSASFGTHNGADFSYSAYVDTNEPTASSANALITTRQYDKFGRAFKSFDAAGHETRSEYDDAGRTVTTIAGYVNGVPSDPGSGDDDVFTRYVYASGLQTKMWVDLDGDNVEDAGVDQVTTYAYGVTTSDSPGPSAINANNLLRTVTYPPQMDAASNVVTSAYNALGQTIYTKDQAGIVLLTSYDTAGREVHRRTENDATDVGSKGFDTRVLRMSTTYNDRGLVETLSQYDNPAIGSGTVQDEVKYVYDNAGMLDKIHQDADSAIGASGMTTRVVDLRYDYSGLAATGAGRDAYRLGRIDYPDSSPAVLYSYGSDIWQAAGHVSNVVIGSSFLVTYRYNGASHLIEQRLSGITGSSSQRGIVSSLDEWESGSFRSYTYMDRFDRVTRSFWRMDTGDPSASYVNNTNYPYDPAYYDVEIKASGGGTGYDDNSNIVGITDNRWSTFSQTYTVDAIDRLTDATVFGASSPREQFTMDRLGNFSNMLFDANSNGTLTDASDLNDCRTHTQSNEIATRDFSCNSSADRSPKYNAVGELSSDDSLASGYGYKYTWDVFGRLTKIQTNDTTTPVTVAEFKYDARNHRIAWRHPLAGGGGSAPESRWFYPIYDHRWRIIEVERDTDGSGTMAWYERFYYHNAGLDGEGGASYVDAVFRRERDAALDGGTLEEVLTYLQNWRGDVVAMVKPDGWVEERARYSAYGRPFNIQAGDYNASGYVSVQDYFDFYADQAAGNANADYNFNGTVSVQDIFDFLSASGYFDPNNVTSGPGSGWDTLSRSDHGNRKGYAGYEFLAAPLASSGSGDVAPGMWQARHRWYRAGTGAWVSRDPVLIDDYGLYRYAKSRPIVRVDVNGLYSASTRSGTGCNGCNASAFPTPPSTIICAGSACSIPRIIDIVTTNTLDKYLPPPTPPPGTIPGCPEHEPGSTEGDGWCKEGDHGYHCGLSCYRSYGTNTTGGQQCCYNKDGSLNSDPKCMGSIDLCGTASRAGEWWGDCILRIENFRCHLRRDVDPYDKDPKRYVQIQCCLRKHGIPSGSPGTGVPDSELERKYKYCSDSVDRDRTVDWCKDYSK